MTPHRILLGVIALIPLLIAAYSFGEARRDPVVRRTMIALPDWPAGARPVRVVLVSDIHIGSPAMNAARLQRIATRINALHPDYVFIAGDLIFGHAPDSAGRIGASMVAPLAAIRPRIAKIAVLGNHDNWTGADTVRTQLREAGFIVLENQAASVGPLAIAGIGDDFSHRTDLAKTLKALKPLKGARLFVTHSPDIAPDLPPGSVLLAGHTHCGQVVLPFYGPISNVSRFGARFQCGLVREPGRTVVVTAGVGTSAVPFRLGAPPDLWLIRLGPATSPSG